MGIRFVIRLLTFYLSRQQLSVQLPPQPLPPVCPEVLLVLEKLWAFQLEDQISSGSPSLE